MDEIISGVQVIKMYAWEKPFCAMIELARKLELRIVTKTSYIRGIYMSFGLFTTRMALFSTVISIVLLGDKLTADRVFVISAYFNILSQTMTGMFVRGIAETAECMVAVRRLQYFLMYDEFKKIGSYIQAHGSQLSVFNSNRGSMLSVNHVSKPDLPYIDDELNEFHDNNGRKKSNGLAVLASDLLKDTADIVNGERNRIEE